MIYLLGQIVLALMLAALLGGAIGWLVHRASHTADIEQLNGAIRHQQNQLKQAQSDVAMLTDDYDDLQQRSQDEIDGLREQNRQIPFLNTNLEKSQLLVRQMMQKHEAKVRDLSTENQSLTQKLKNIEDRRQANNQVQAELDSARRRQIANEAADTQYALDTPDDTAHDRLSAHEPFDDGADDTEAGRSTDSDNTSEATVEVEGLARHRVADDSPAPDNIADKPATATTVSNTRNRASWASAPLDTAAKSTADAHNKAETDADTDPFDNVVEVASDLQRELDIEPNEDPLLHGSADRSNLFEPVEQRDDLKQIFGIGPVTEQALNDLGITSYSQLAELKHHEIETIANALQIVPGRIERDDWVGNARRQLEDVLEEL